ncbi:MAG TPA: glycosyltransferase family 39 protein [Bryobacteraceae bacterium]|nr:glycosyltransferase family 39 protein [Bryobacteraceae bacterium]
MLWKRAAILVASAALFFLYFFGLTRTGLLGPDEPRYAAIGQAMAQTGDWVTPRLWGDPWFEKPALLYWMTAAGFKAGLDEDLAPRLPVAVLSVAFLIYFFLALRQEFGERAAFYATVILATSAGWLAYSHISVPDLPMSAAFAAAMLLVMRESNTKRNACIAGLLLGIAILAKGLVPLALFIPAIWFLRRRIKDLLVVFVVAAAIAAPWYILATMRNGLPFLEELFWKHHFGRFFTPELQHERPFWFFIPVLAAGLFPWTPLALLLFWKRLYRDHRTAFLLAWFVFGFVLFSASRNKLPGYLLPLIPPVAALIGVAIAEAPARAGKVVFPVALSAALLWFIPAIHDLLPQALLSGMSHVQFRLPLSWVLPALLVTLCCALLARNGRVDWALGLVAVLITASVVRMIWQVYPQLDNSVSARARWKSSSKSIICLGDETRSWHYGLNYYARRHLPDCD